MPDELGELKEAFPGQGFSITPADNDVNSHRMTGDTLEAEMVFLNVMGYSANARDCLQVVINEARHRQEAAMDGTTSEVAF